MGKIRGSRSGVCVYVDVDVDVSDIGDVRGFV